jgi:hypothetical protein
MVSQVSAAYALKPNKTAANTLNDLMQALMGDMRGLYGMRNRFLDVKIFYFGCRSTGPKRFRPGQNGKSIVILYQHRQSKNPASQTARGISNTGVADGARTHDNRNHNPGLYQLSYSHRSPAL